MFGVSVRLLTSTPGLLQRGRGIRAVGGQEFLRALGGGTIEEKGVFHFRITQLAGEGWVQEIKLSSGCYSFPGVRVGTDLFSVGYESVLGPPRSL